MITHVYNTWVTHEKHTDNIKMDGRFAFFPRIARRLGTHNNLVGEALLPDPSQGPDEHALKLVLKVGIALRPPCQDGSGEPGSAATHACDMPT